VVSRECEAGAANKPQLRGSVEQNSIPEAETKVPKVGTDAIAWPAAPSPVRANNTIWPDPATSNHTDTLSAPDVSSKMTQKLNADAFDGHRRRQNNCPPLVYLSNKSFDQNSCMQHQPAVLKVRMGQTGRALLWRNFKVTYPFGYSSHFYSDC
jgi:hypothetical protein